MIDKVIKIVLIEKKELVSNHGQNHRSMEKGRWTLWASHGGFYCNHLIKRIAKNFLELLVA